MELMVPDPHPLPNGLVIMFEGIDGAGKTTQLELVQKALEEAGWPLMATRNLGGTPIGEALRKVIKSPLERPPLTDLYISLAIQEPLLDIIDQARKEGKVILMDRGPLSLAAYQVHGTAIDRETGWQQVANGMDRIKPEAIILYDIDMETAAERRQPDKADYFEQQPAAYFQRVSEGYQEAVERYPATVIDGTQSVVAVQEQTLAAVAKLLVA